MAGLLDFFSALTPPLEQRLHAVTRLVPLAVPQVAAAGVAVAGIALLVLARGIRRGGRDAYRAALLLLGGSVVLHIVKGVDLEEAAVAGLVGLYLLAHRRAFTVERGSRARLASLRIAAGVAAVVASSALAVEAATAARGHRLPWPTALAAVAERLVGITTVDLPARIDQFISPAILAVGLFGVVAVPLALMWPRRGPRSSGTERDHARHLVEKWGAGTLDAFALRADKEFFFSGSSVVAYAVHLGVCLVSPDPIGPLRERDEVWEAFRHFADRHGWAVAVLGAGEDWLPLYRSSGMRDLYVGDEAIVDVRRFSLEGGRRKGLRHAVNRLARAGYRVRSTIRLRSTATSRTPSGAS